MNYMRIIFKKFKARMIVGCILAVIALLAVSVIVFINQASFGRTPRGERLERVMKSQITETENLKISMKLY